MTESLIGIGLLAAALAVHMPAVRRLAPSRALGFLGFWLGLIGLIVLVQAVIDLS